MKRTLFAAALALGMIAASAPLVLAGEPTTTAPAPQTAEPATEPAAEGTEPAAVEGLGAALAPVFLHDVDTYTVTVITGSAGPELSVVPKTGFHVNTLYPWKYQATDKTYKREDFALSEEKAALSLAAGEDGELRFSVCNDQTCLIEKVAVTVVAKPE